MGCFLPLKKNLFFGGETTGSEYDWGVQHPTSWVSQMVSLHSSCFISPLLPSMGFLSWSVSDDTFQIRGSKKQGPHEPSKITKRNPLRCCFFCRDNIIVYHSEGGSITAHFSIQPCYVGLQYMLKGYKFVPVMWWKLPSSRTGHYLLQFFIRGDPNWGYMLTNL